MFFFFSSRRRHTRYWRDWSSDVCSSDLSTRLADRLLTLGGRHEALPGDAAPQGTIRHRTVRDAQDVVGRIRVPPGLQGYRELPHPVRLGTNALPNFSEGTGDLTRFAPDEVTRKEGKNRCQSEDRDRRRGPQIGRAHV